MNKLERIERLLPEEIEKRSFEIITEELNKQGIVLSKENESIIKRAIHTSADFEYAHSLKFSPDAVKKVKVSFKAILSLIPMAGFAAAYMLFVH